MTTSQERYEAEQAALRQQYGEGDQGSGSDSEDSFVYAEPQVNPEVWRDMDALLFRGFVYQAAQIGDISFVFKSLNQHELERLLLVTKLLPPVQASKQQYNLLLALGVWLIDGVNALVDREQNLKELRTLFSSLPRPAVNKVVQCLSELNRRANRATMLTEAYSSEQASRFRWLQLKGLDLGGTSVTGVEGTAALGMNWGQLAWCALNRLEDQRQEAEASWETAKFIASAMAGSKAISKVNSQDKARRKGELEDRRARKDQILRQALFGEKAAKEAAGPVVQVARTVEELAEQMERDLRGEKDWHDQVIDAYQQQINETERVRTEKMREIQKMHEMEGGLVGASDFRGLSREEVERILLERRVAAQQALAAAEVPLQAVDAKAAERVERWGNALPMGAPSKDTL